ncbi:hypothetical protein [Zoogloea sp.]|uniref:hypothetical protein n=1 Tax=Zoogloea sp. TaxID=49181 RepID=UPI0035B128EE
MQRENECSDDILDTLRRKEKIAERRMVVTSVAPGSITMRVTHRVLVTRDTRDLTDGQVAYGGNLVRDIEHRADLQP